MSADIKLGVILFIAVFAAMVIFALVEPKVSKRKITPDDDESYDTDVDADDDE